MVVNENATPENSVPTITQIPTIGDNGKVVPLTNYDEIRTAFARLKNNKVAVPDGLSAELYKHGIEELTRYIHQLICQTWSDESMPDDLNLSLGQTIERELHSLCQL